MSTNTSPRLGIDGESLAIGLQRAAGNAAALRVGRILRIINDYYTLRR